MNSSHVNKAGGVGHILPIFEFSSDFEICKYVFSSSESSKYCLYKRYGNPKYVRVQPCTPLEIPVFSNSTTFYTLPHDKSLVI